MSLNTFATCQYRDSILKVRRFMFDDINKTIGLADNPNVGAPNFLLALGLCCYTEYWGKLLTGVSKFDASRGRTGFNAFLERLDRVYYGNLISSGVELYNEVRCGLAHAYLIETSGNARIDMGNAGLHGIDYDKTSKKYIFWVRTYFDEFKAAVNRYINGLENGTKNLQNLDLDLLPPPPPRPNASISIAIQAGLLLKAGNFNKKTPGTFVCFLLPSPYPPSKNLSAYCQPFHFPYPYW